MAAREPMNTKLAYVVLYVEDVDRSVQFYQDVFNLKLRREDRSRRCVIPCCSSCVPLVDQESVPR